MMKSSSAFVLFLTGFLAGTAVGSESSGCSRACEGCVPAPGKESTQSECDKCLDGTYTASFETCVSLCVCTGAASTTEKPSYGPCSTRCSECRTNDAQWGWSSECQKCLVGEYPETEWTCKESCVCTALKEGEEEQNEDKPEDKPCGINQCKDCKPSPNYSITQRECSECTNGLQDSQWICNEGCICADEPEEDPEDEKEGTKTPPQDCAGAVSADYGVTSNTECREICDRSWAEFEKTVEAKKCFIFNWTKDSESGKVSFPEDRSCWDQYVHGYSDEGFVGSGGGDAEVALAFVRTETISECQEACQEEEGCVRFIFRVTDNGSYTAGLCLLKSQDHVTGAQNTELTSADAEAAAEDKRWKWCNLLMGYSCSDAGNFECIECPETRCVWKSDLHVSGPRFCGKHRDMNICDWTWPATLKASTPNMRCGCCGKANCHCCTDEEAH